MRQLNTRVSNAIMHTIDRALSTRGAMRRAQTGSALVEAALVFPLLLLIAMGTADYARVFYTAIAVANAASAGTRYAVAKNSSSNLTGMQTAATNDANVTGMTATASTFCHCEDGTTVTCSGSCGAQGKVLVYVQVSTQATFTPLVKHPFIPSSVVVNGKSVMRIQ